MFRTKARRTQRNLRQFRLLCALCAFVRGLHYEVQIIYTVIGYAVVGFPPARNIYNKRHKRSEPVNQSRNLQIAQRRRNLKIAALIGISDPAQTSIPAFVTLLLYRLPLNRTRTGSPTSTVVSTFFVVISISCEVVSTLLCVSSTNR